MPDYLSIQSNPIIIGAIDTSRHTEADKTQLDDIKNTIREHSNEQIDDLTDVSEYANDQLDDNLSNIDYTIQRQIREQAVRTHQAIQDKMNIVNWLHNCIVDQGKISKRLKDRGTHGAYKAAKYLAEIERTSKRIAEIVAQQTNQADSEEYIQLAIENIYVGLVFPEYKPMMNSGKFEQSREEEEEQFKELIDNEVNLLWIEIINKNDNLVFDLDPEDISELCEQTQVLQDRVNHSLDNKTQSTKSQTKSIEQLRDGINQTSSVFRKGKSSQEGALKQLSRELSAILFLTYYSLATYTKSLKNRLGESKAYYQMSHEARKILFENINTKQPSKNHTQAQKERIDDYNNRNTLCRYVIEQQQPSANDDLQALRTKSEKTEIMLEMIQDKQQTPSHWIQNQNKQSSEKWLSEKYSEISRNADQIIAEKDQKAAYLSRNEDRLAITDLGQKINHSHRVNHTTNQKKLNQLSRTTEQHKKNIDNRQEKLDSTGRETFEKKVQPQRPGLQPEPPKDIDA